MSNDWIVHDMDEGVLRREPTKREAVAWFQKFADTPRVNVTRYAAGCYGLMDTDQGQEFRTSAALVRSDYASSNGIDGDETALYPVPGDPFERVERS